MGSEVNVLDGSSSGRLEKGCITVLLPDNNNNNTTKNNNNNNNNNIKIMFQRPTTGDSSQTERESDTDSSAATTTTTPPSSRINTPLITSSAEEYYNNNNSSASILIGNNNTKSENSSNNNNTNFLHCCHHAEKSVLPSSGEVLHPEDHYEEKKKKSTTEDETIIVEGDDSLGGGPVIIDDTEDANTATTATAQQLRHETIQQHQTTIIQHPETPPPRRSDSKQSLSTSTTSSRSIVPSPHSSPNVSVQQQQQQQSVPPLYTAYNPFTCYSPNVRRRQSVHRREVMGMSVLAYAQQGYSRHGYDDDDHSDSSDDTTTSAAAASDNNFDDDDDLNSTTTSSTTCTIDSEMALEHAARQIRLELLQAEMNELANEAERAAEEGRDSFAATPCVFQDDINLCHSTITPPTITTTTMMNLPKPSMMRRSFSEGANLQPRPTYNNKQRRSYSSLKDEQQQQRYYNSTRAYYSQHAYASKLRVTDLRDVTEVFPSFRQFHTHMRTHFFRNKVSQSQLLFEEISSDKEENNSKEVLCEAFPSSKRTFPYSSRQDAHNIICRTTESAAAALLPLCSNQTTGTPLIQKDNSLDNTFTLDQWMPQQSLSAGSEDDNATTEGIEIVGEILANHVVTKMPTIRPKIRIPPGLESDHTGVFLKPKTTRGGPFGSSNNNNNPFQNNNNWQNNNTLQSEVDGTDQGHTEHDDNNTPEGGGGSDGHRSRSGSPCMAAGVVPKSLFDNADYDSADDDEAITENNNSSSSPKPPVHRRYPSCPAPIYRSRLSPSKDRRYNNNNITTPKASLDKRSNSILSKDDDSSSNMDSSTKDFITPARLREIRNLSKGTNELLRNIEAAGLLLPSNSIAEESPIRSDLHHSRHRTHPSMLRMPILEPVLDVSDSMMTNADSKDSSSVLFMSKDLNRSIASTIEGNNSFENNTSDMECFNIPKSRLSMKFEKMSPPEQADLSTGLSTFSQPVSPIRRQSLMKSASCSRIIGNTMKNSDERNNKMTPSINVHSVNNNNMSPGHKVGLHGDELSSLNQFTVNLEARSYPNSSPLLNRSNTDTSDVFRSLQLSPTRHSESMDDSFLNSSNRWTEGDVTETSFLETPRPSRKEKLSDILEHPVTLPALAGMRKKQEDHPTRKEITQEDGNKVPKEGILPSTPYVEDCVCLSLSPSHSFDLAGAIVETEQELSPSGKMRKSTSTGALHDSVNWCDTTTTGKPDDKTCRWNNEPPRNKIIAAIDVLSKVSPRGGKDVVNRALYVRSKENDEFINNFLYWSQPGTYDGQISDGCEPCGEATYTCGDVNSEYCCTTFNPFTLTMLFQSRPSHVSNTLVKLSGTGIPASKADPESWFEFANEKFDGALERFVGSVPRHSSPFNVSFQAPSLKKRRNSRVKQSVADEVIDEEEDEGHSRGSMHDNDAGLSPSDRDDCCDDEKKFDGIGLFDIDEPTTSQRSESRSPERSHHHVRHLSLMENSESSLVVDGQLPSENSSHHGLSDKHFQLMYGIPKDRFEAKADAVRIFKHSKSA